MSQTEQLPAGQDDQSRGLRAITATESTACAGLRQCASKATRKLGFVKSSDLRTIVEDLLRDIGRHINAREVHLYQVRLNERGSGIVGLRYRSGGLSGREPTEMLNLFQFQLFSDPVQNLLRAHEIIVIRQEQSCGGRLLTDLISQLGCASYVLCPLHVEGKLCGILGVAVDDDHSALRIGSFIELLKLNGNILIHSVLRTRRERRRRVRLREWRRIANQACDFAVTVDDRNVICSTAAFGMGPFTPELSGLRLADITSRSGYVLLQQQIAQAVSRRKAITCDFPLILGSGGPHWYLARIEPSDGSSRAVATLYLTDNHPDKIREQEIRELTDQLAKASRLSLLGQMSTEFAHQLNQPLQAILNYCNTLQKRLAKGTATVPQSLATMENIEKSVLHSAEIIQRIREFVSFRTLSTEDVSLDAIIEQAVMMVMPTVHARNAELRTPAEGSGLTVNVDRVQSTHVLVNLMVNALEACCEFGIDRPRIEIFHRVDSRQGRVVVAVRDNGPGLPGASLETIFRKFYSGKKEGLGMGLAISREVAESQGGSLSAENNQNTAGCTFFFSLILTGHEGSDTAELETLPAQDLPAD